ncbi:MAG TPA: FixH family protein [Steroidobacteraceae bacterium]|nr:FixH family protein [Steroidobacteraceae bacterium]
MSPRENPVFWLIWTLPAAAVLAGFTTLAIALQGADRTLPEAYHWEGERLDADFARQRAAVTAGIRVMLAAEGGRCAVRVAGAAGDPPALDVLLTHGTDAGLDRALKLPRVGADEYAADCAAPPPGKWRIQVDSPGGAWSVRGSVDGALHRVELRARDPSGAS